MKNILLVLSLVILTGCATNPWLAQMQALEMDYRNGVVTQEQYVTLMQQYRQNSAAFEGYEHQRMQNIANSLQSSGQNYNERAMYNTLPGGSQKQMRKYMQNPPKEYEIINSQTGQSTGYSLEEK
jgi:Na+-translocating ferredoxin:NAD+ oxidoreductase RnfC subunit